MRDTRIVIGILSAVLLAGGLAACGDGDSEPSTTAAPIGASAERATSKSGSSQADDSTGMTGGSSKRAGSSEGSGSSQSNAGSGGESKDPKVIRRSEAKEASKFSPKPYNDSQAVTEQFIVKGGDNSIQEFGQEAPGADFEEAAAVLHNYYDAYAANNWAAACLYVSSDIIKSLETTARYQSNEPRGCAELLEVVLGSGSNAGVSAEAKAIEAVAMRVEGDRGFLIYVGYEKYIEAMSMVKEGGHWKVAALTGVDILPPNWREYVD